MLQTLEDAKKYQSDNKHLIGRILEPEKTELLDLVILKKTSEEAGLMWANQKEPFEETDESYLLTDEEFNNQIEAIKNSDLTPEDGYFFLVVGIFRTKDGQPRFEPLHWILSSNA